MPARTAEHKASAALLGAAQMFGAFRRDRAPFVLTPEFVCVCKTQSQTRIELSVGVVCVARRFAMGGKESENYERFCDIACKAFNLVRANARIMISLFRMMVSTGIPELQSVEDIDYLRQALALDLNDDRAHDLFKSLVGLLSLYLSIYLSLDLSFVPNQCLWSQIEEILASKATTLNFAIHLWAKNPATD